MDFLTNESLVGYFDPAEWVYVDRNSEDVDFPSEKINVSIDARANVDVSSITCGSTE